MEIRYPGTKYLIFGDRVSGYQRIRNLDIRSADNQASDMWISDMWVPDIRSLDINPTPGHFRKQPNQPRHTATKYHESGDWMSRYQISEICRSDIRVPNISNLELGCPGTKYLKSADRISGCQISEIWISDVRGPYIRG